MGLRMCLARMAAWFMSRNDDVSAVLRISDRYAGSSARMAKICGAYGSTIIARTRYRRRAVADGRGADESRWEWLSLCPTFEVIMELSRHEPSPMVHLATYPVPGAGRRLV